MNSTIYRVHCMAFFGDLVLISYVFNKKVHVYIYTLYYILLYILLFRYHSIIINLFQRFLYKEAHNQSYHLPFLK